MNYHIYLLTNILRGGAYQERLFVANQQRIGERIQIHGLTKRPDLNGKLGIIENYNSANGKYRVKVLNSDEQIYINQDKFKLIKDTSPTDNIKFFSWNIYFKIRKPDEYSINAALKKQREVLNFIEEQKADIFFTQESIVSYDEATSINFNYDVISWDTQYSGISIVFDTTKFRLISDILRVSIDDNPFNYNGIDVSSIKIKSDPIDETTKRPMLGIKLLHRTTNKHILFINLWAVHDIISNQNKGKFLDILQTIISILGYVKGDRIIISGDFNEFYEQGRSDVGILLINILI